jgi:hypothetical protein
VLTVVVEGGNSNFIVGVGTDEVGTRIEGTEGENDRYTKAVDATRLDNAITVRDFMTALDVSLGLAQLRGKKSR